MSRRSIQQQNRRSDGAGAGSAGPGQGADKVLVRFPITNAASQSSANSIPGGAVVTRAWLEVTTPYSATATITLGQTGSAALLLATGDSSPTDAIVGPDGYNTYNSHKPVPWGASALPLLVTVANAPAAGAGFAAAEYYLPLA